MTRSTACIGGAPVFVVSSYAPVAALRAAYAPVLASLSKSLGCRVSLTIAASVAEEITLANTGRAVIVELGGLGFAWAYHCVTKPGAVDCHANRVAPVATWADQYDAPAARSASIWVRSNSSLKDLRMLAGRKVALGPEGSLVTDLFPRGALIDAGVAKRIKVVRVAHDLDAVRGLVSQRVDAAEIESRTAAAAAERKIWNPSLFTQLWHSDPLPFRAVTLSPKLDGDARDDVRAALLAVPASATVRISRLLGYVPPAQGAGMVEIGKGSYDPYFGLAKTLGLTIADAARG